MYTFEYNKDKDELLKETRKISFEQIIMFISLGYVIAILDHHNKQEYPNQRIYLLDINDQIWLVPYIQKDDVIFLKTAFPSSKYTKQYKRR